MTANPKTITQAITRIRHRMERLRYQGETASCRFERQLLQRLQWVLARAEWVQ